MSYHRRFHGMGDDGTITSPSQVDPSLPPSGSVIVGEVSGPKRVNCEDLPADSYWRQPGKPCAPVPGMFDFLADLFGKPTTAAPPTASSVATQAASSPLPMILLLGGLAAGGYYLTRKKKAGS